MTRHLYALAPASRRNASGAHLRIRSTSAGSQRDIVDLPKRSAPAPAPLTRFRSAIPG